MKLVNQSFNIINQTDFSLIGIKKFIERCGRVCYKSEDRITDTSYEKFVDMLENKHHDRPLEFGTVHLKMDVYDYDEFVSDLVNAKILNQMWIEDFIVEETAYITTNYRYYLQIIDIYPKYKKYFIEEDNEYYPKRYTVHFILSRAIMDEFRTHVGLSHLAESTRYCSYNKDRFNNEVSIIDSNWFDKEKMDYTVYNEYTYNFLEDAEHAYFALIDNGATPQQARDVLPLSVKSELISCGFENAWDNFFYRRCAKDAHPMARQIAQPLKALMFK